MTKHSTANLYRLPFKKPLRLCVLRDQNQHFARFPLAGKLKDLHRPERSHPEVSASGGKKKERTQQESYTFILSCTKHVNEV